MRFAVQPRRQRAAMLLIVVTAVLLQALTAAAWLWQRRQRQIAEARITQQRAELARMGRFALAGELSASIAHEVAQPLGAILSNADAAGMLLADRPRTSELDSILTDIRRDALRANQVVQRLRALLQKHTPTRGPLDLKAIFDETLELLRPEARRRQITLESRLAATHALIMGDHVQMQQVLLNLAINAMDAMEHTPPARRTLFLRLALATKLTGEGCELTVADRGHGIPDEASERLFDPLYTTKPHGMGLGLAIVRNIVLAHGGFVSAANREGGGSVFTVWLPALPGQSTARALRELENAEEKTTFKARPATQGGHP
ncbi:sensor histidine kinase [Paraburkholderia sp. DHOC27]|uniref:sensor histidine kinase n=1 Tax=Paraburkholderia sp. DHOC27 TaxID=2303330 RepID=UPI000E3E5CC4|nr:ATP-binding protein [Paraburkholderia sp. DHOC27]RFU44773.1 hypothetical protein D0B32_27170 [Paraburkholderia sp. DHOC27]